MTDTIGRLAAFTTDPRGGNPAGVHLGDTLPEPDRMQAIAADIGYSETAFLAPESPGATRSWTTRYYSPAAEVDFCGHATIASAVRLAEVHGPGAFTLHTNVGPIEVDTTTAADGAVLATLQSVPPRVDPLDDEVLDALLATFGWDRSALADGYPPAVAYAGVFHPVLALASRADLAEMTYDFDTLLALMTAQGWTTVQVVVPRDPVTFDARDPFPVGGVVEDPATGAAAAAFGGYLRANGLVSPPATVTVVQGEDMGRRSVLTIDIPVGTGGISVSGNAVALD